MKRSNKKSQSKPSKADILSALRGLHCQDDPSADRFKDVPQWAVDLGTKIDTIKRVTGETSGRLIDVDDVFSSGYASFSTELKALREVLIEYIDKTSKAVIDDMQLAEVDHTEALRCKINMLTKFVEKWHTEDAERYAADTSDFSTRYNRLCDLLSFLDYQIRHKPGFWTIFFASMAGGAGLLILLAACAALGFFANQHWG